MPQSGILRYFMLIKAQTKSEMRAANILSEGNGKT